MVPLAAPVDVGPGVTVVVCPDKFRGSVSARQAAAALGAPFRRAGARVVELPLADGGEGFLEILADHLAGSAQGRDHPDSWRRTSVVVGPSGTSVAAPWALTADGTAIIEAAQACGHPAVAADRAQPAHPVDPVQATTRGVGQLLVAARGAGARRALVGIGGTVTTDGGIGALEAMGWSAGGLEIVVAVDTRTRYLDAARVFAPQKGADADQVEELGERLRTSALAIEQRTGVDVTGLDGGGAGGGLAGGLAALGATVAPGVEVVAEACGLDRQLHEADLVVTGEGCLDRTSLDGKALGWVLDRAPEGRRAIVVGDAEDEALLALGGDVLVRVLAHSARDRRDSMERAVELLEAAATSLVAERWGPGRPGEPGEPGDPDASARSGTSATPGAVGATDR